MAHGWPLPAARPTPANNGENNWANANDNWDMNGNFTKFGQNGLPYSITYDFTKPVSFNAYNWATANDGLPGRNPIEWKIEGSTDGTDWTMVDNRTNASQGEGPQTRTRGPGQPQQLSAL